MKIIQANKFFYPKGGADKYFLTLIEELEKSGDTVIPFAMASNQNIGSSWNAYFSEPIDYYQSKQYFKIARRLIWNKEAALKFSCLLDDTKPDLIHVHNIYHQLSPSILAEAKKRQIPVVMTLHDYKLICPNYLMFTHGVNCQRCLTGNYLNCLTNNCYYSYPKSALASLESFLHNKVWHSYRDNINLFISPSEYLKKMMVKAGWNKDKIIVLTNPAPKYEPQADGERLLYAGRLSLEKGVDILIKALKSTNEQLDIAGSGPKEKDLKNLAKELGLEKRITFHGHLSGKALEELKKQAKAIILPSIWQENMPLIILEALAYDKIVIASNSGGVPEIIEEGKTGFLFSPGNITELTEKIEELNKLTSEQRLNISRQIKEKITPLDLEKHLIKLKSIYKTLTIKQ